MIHIEANHWDDIGYNFLVAGDAYAYEGRGWGAVGSFVRGWNTRSIGVAFIGTFTAMRPTEEQVKTFRKLIAWGVSIGQIRPDYKLVGACQLQPNESPGRLLVLDMMKWPHWYNGTGRSCHV